MTERTIHITELDMRRLRELLREAQWSDYRGSVYLKDLERELGRAQVVAPSDVPRDVVTMHSRVSLADVESGEEMTFTLVFPDEAGIGEGRISVLAPIGTAMLGYRVGDIFEWEVPEGKRRLRVKEVFYQPEASGNYDPRAASSCISGSDAALSRDQPF
jgi:regulator of nucleoside diphosphate kinase